MQKNKQFYDNFYSNYPVDVHNNPDRFNSVSALLRGKVLDVACGTGTLSCYFAGEYFGVDISSVAINKAILTRRSSAVFKVADFNKDAFSYSSKFDSAYIGEFLEHVEDDHIIFDNLKSLLKPNARVVVTVPNGDRIPDESHCRTFTVARIRRDFSKYGKVTFHDYPDFKKRILFTIDFDIPDENKISLVMTVKDEHKGIEDAIISALPYVDHVVVSVDSATTDSTREIAEMYADELREHVWQNNFSTARNSAQKNVKSKWIMFIDGHEYIESVGNFLDYLDSGYDGINVTVKMEDGLTFMYPRIFKNGLQFENAVHNAVDCKNVVYCPRFVVVHDRTNRQSQRSAHARQIQRNKMIPKIMKATLAKNPDDQRALFNLANWHMTQGDFKQALTFYKLCFKNTPSPDERYFVKAQIGIAHQLLGHGFRALWTFFDCEKIIPNRWETKRLIGGSFMFLGFYQKALDYLVFALDPNHKTYIYQLFKQDPAELWDLIAHCFSETNQPEKAVIAWRSAIQFTDDEQRKAFFRTKINLSAMLCKNPVVASSLDLMTPTSCPTLKN